ncbi:MAG: glucuronate isomerase [Clostridiales bacterium]|jgi:glucuronate isomerase|nr:glucuronate isomerase [Clostridiales bacterium]
MRKFLDSDFLLQSDPAKVLYHEYAEKMPIVDYHCHISPMEIALDKRYETITEAWLGGDHYKWRLLRAHGYPEEQVTGAINSDPLGLFKRYAAVLPRAVGNPLYHWTYLEMKRYFGIEEILNEDSAERIYAELNSKLKGMSVRSIIKSSGVKLLCTTDDPADTLEWHDMIAADESFDVKVLPAFRPDKAMNLEKPEFPSYIEKLEKASGTSIQSFSGLVGALRRRIDFFASRGCRAADHGIDFGLYEESSEDELDLILKKALEGSAPDSLEAEKYRTALFRALAACYKSYGWVMQIHFGALRNINTRLLPITGPDSGFDGMNGNGRVEKLSKFLDSLDQAGNLPRTILYSLNPSESQPLVSIAGCFNADAGCPGKVQIGSAWWFSDTKDGMEAQLADFANGTLIGNFNGMLTDSRSFLSYTRHEYFRRILCNYIGQMVENGECHADFTSLGSIIQDICCYNAIRYFGFKL